jgi:MoaA/NifB/PqqE/SkfB family radical SAM enzyme
MQTADVVRAWKTILSGRPPLLSIEVTRECPLRCPGCYAYEPDHVGGGVTLRELNDRKGDALVHGVLAIADEIRPLHISLVGGDPLVRHREMEALVPQLLERGIHVQVVTSAFRPIPQSWARLPHLSVVVSIDGLRTEHDERRKPATYDRILANIRGQQIIVHCTITAQMLGRSRYLEEFLRFWSDSDDVRKVWFSLFTPQRGAVLDEILSDAQRRQVVAELMELRKPYPKLDMPAGLIQQFVRTPSSPDECIFAQSTETISADLRTRITPCQFGGDPDCSQCGCVASMALAAVGAHKLAGVIPVGAIYRTSLSIGRARRRKLTVESPDIVREIALAKK